jgi:hypothetical protein
MFMPSEPRLYQYDVTRVDVPPFGPDRVADVCPGWRDTVRPQTRPFDPVTVLETLPFMRVALRVADRPFGPVTVLLLCHAKAGAADTPRKEIRQTAAKDENFIAQTPKNRSTKRKQRHDH